LNGKSNSASPSTNQPFDPTIAEKLNIYCFADYKEKVIDLQKRVCAVSLKTMEIVRQME